MTRNPLMQSVLAASVAAAFPAFAFAQSVAKVDFAIGNPTVAGPDGRSRPLVKGADVNVGELIATNKGRVQLRFADGAQMALQPDTDFKVEQFRFTQKGEGGDNVVMNLLKGGMRTITGLIGRSDRANYALKTPSATIGIRGTEFTAEFRDALRAFCVQGLIALENGGGSLLLAGGQGAFVANFTTQPQRDDTKPSLPTISKQEMDVLLKVAGVDPNNPTQDFDPVVTLQTALAQLGDTKLTGTFEGNWAAAYQYNRKSQVKHSLTLDSTGKLTQFADTVEGSGTNTLGTAMATSKGNDGIVAWGNWMDGTTGGDGYFSGTDLNTSAYGPLHYVVGLPVSSMPTSGEATYNMIGYSASCSGGGCTGLTVNSSSLSVNFGAMTVGVAMSLSVTGGSSAGTHTYSAGGQALGSGGAFSGCGGLTTSACFGSLGHSGFLSGSGAVRAGMAWNGQLYNLGNYTYISGANAYKKQ